MFIFNVIQSLAVFDPNALDKSSGTIGYEIINDLRNRKMRSPNRRSTPESGRYLRSQETSDRQPRYHDEIAITPIHPIVQRVVKKRTKQSLVGSLF